jgi:transcriptional accessory protein Tex/SPT6
MKRINRPGEVVKDGDKVRAKVLGIDREKRRISLSMAEAERDAKIASGELQPEPAKPAAAPGAPGAAPAAGAAAAKGAPSKNKKPLKGGL